MLVLTGGIASGKSTVAQMLVRRGFAVIDADEIAHEVLDENAATIAQIFGAEFVESGVESGEDFGENFAENLARDFTENSAPNPARDFANPAPNATNPAPSPAKFEFGADGANFARDCAKNAANSAPNFSQKDKNHAPNATIPAQKLAKFEFATTAQNLAQNPAQNFSNKNKIPARNLSTSNSRKPRVNRAKLGSLVFSNPAAKAQLEALLHPQIHARICAAAADLTARKVPFFADIPLFFESAQKAGAPRYPATRVAVVWCDEPTQLARLAARNGLDGAAARARLAAQLPLCDKAARADFVIDNGGSRESLGREVARFVRWLGADFGADFGAVGAGGTGGAGGADENFGKRQAMKVSKFNASGNDFVILTRGELARAAGVFGADCGGWCGGAAGANLANSNLADFAAQGAGGEIPRKTLVWLAKRLCDRARGVGADGLIVINPREKWREKSAQNGGENLNLCGKNGANSNLDGANGANVKLNGADGKIPTAQTAKFEFAADDLASRQAFRPAAQTTANADDIDFSWDFFNSDGSEAGMCGNGSRAAAFFAFKRGFCGEKTRFLTSAGVIAARICGAADGGNLGGNFGEIVVQNPAQNGADCGKIPPQNPAKNGEILAQNSALVEVAFSRAVQLAAPFCERGFEWAFFDTGVPHLVCFAGVAAFDADVCRAMRAKYNANVSFAEIVGGAGAGGENGAAGAGGAEFLGGGRTLRVRTFERGVEGETGACGTGMAACFVAAALYRGLFDGVGAELATQITNSKTALANGENCAATAQANGANNAKTAVANGANNAKTAPNFTHETAQNSNLAGLSCRVIPTSGEELFFRLEIGNCAEKNCEKPAKSAIAELICAAQNGDQNALNERLSRTQIYFKGAVEHTFDAEFFGL